MNDKKPTRVDDQFLAQMGLPGLKGKQKQKAMGSILNSLNIAVGRRISGLLSEEQVDEFEQLTAADNFDEEKLASWLKENVPNYEQILEEETQNLRDDAQWLTDHVMKMGHAGAEPSF